MLFFKRNIELSLFGMVLFFSISFSFGQERVEHFSFGAYQDLELPELVDKDSNLSPKKIRIAIIDDGFRLSHELIKPFLPQKPADIPNNRLDDDGNGFVDDTYGWNVSDDNNEISMAEGLERKFFHGTMVASIIATVFKEAYGKNASEYLEFIPIKAISNQTTTTYIKDGYKGIEYAMACGVDIICCAWSGGELTNAQKEILEKAAQRGIVIIGSAGNFYGEVLPPASHESVIAVTAVDSNQVMLPSANYGLEIDFVARGDKVRAGHPLDDRAFFYGEGSSSAVALLVGAYGLVLSQYPDANKNRIVDALKFTSIPVNHLNMKKAGSLGAGIPQVSKALEYLANAKSYASNFNPKQSEGSIHFYPQSPLKSYEIQPDGAYYGIEFQIDPFVKKQKVSLELTSPDTSFLLNSSDTRFFNKQIAGGANLRIVDKSKKLKAPLRINYQVVSIDSSELYCKNTKYLYVPKEGLQDGSGTLDYTNECNCKWIIEAPQGKRIKLEVTAMDTEANVDFLWVFHGDASREENLMAKFSGNNIPPVITSPSNKVLLWFLANEEKTGKGWELNYSWVD